MNPGAAFAAHLDEELEALELRCSSDVLEGLRLHYELMLQWGKKVNLTSIFDPAQAARLHAADALLFDEVLPPAERIVDAGSGAGFPGLAIALRRPDSRILLLEPLRKRCSFLKVVVSRLRLGNVEVIEGRLEPAGASPAVGRFEGVVSRATWSPSEWVKLGVSLVEPGGHLLVSGGRGVPESKIIAEAGQSVGLTWQARRRFRLGDADRVLDLLRLTA